MGRFVIGVVLLLLAVAALGEPVGKSEGGLIVKRGQEQEEEDDLVVVGTVDGTLHGLSRGKLLWSYRTGPALASHYAEKGAEALVPGADGMLYVMEEDGSARAAADIAELVQRSPALAGQVAWTGKKKGQVFVLDAKSGKPLEEGGQGEGVVVGRVDYVLRGKDGKRGGQEVWNVTWGAYVGEVEGRQGDLWALGNRVGGRGWETHLSAEATALFRADREARGKPLVLRSVWNAGAAGAVGYLRRGGEDGSASATWGIAAGPASASAPSPAKTQLLLPALPPSPDWKGDDGEGDEEEVSFESWEVRWLIAGSAAVVLLSIAIFSYLGGRKTKKDPEEQQTQPPPKEKEEEKIEEIKGRVGKLEVFEDKVLGYGSGGTLVCEGRLAGRPVAVKRMLRAFWSLAERECAALLRGDSHPNVVSYFMREEDGQFVYLALSLCAMSLAEVYEEPGAEGRRVFTEEQERTRQQVLEDPSRIVKEMAAGIAHLHEIGICHMDLKPHNVLVGFDGRVQISDMGLSRKMEHLHQSFSTASSGTLGYRAPEVMKGERQSAKVDVWGFGCLAFYVLSRGHHPYGPLHQRDSNVLASRPQLLSLLSHDPLARNLVARCIASKAAERPLMSAIRTHPFFWDARRRLLFLLDVSDLLEALEENPAVAGEFERMHRKVLGREGQWQLMVHPQLAENLGRYRRYTNSVKDLLRVVRNKSHHYRDLSPELQDILGSHPAGYLHYFCSRFPNLFLECYKFVERRYSQEAVFRGYFEPPE